MKSAVLHTRRSAPSRARRGAAPAKEIKVEAGEKPQLKANPKLGKAVAKANHQAGSKVKRGSVHPLDVLPNVATFESAQH